MKPETTPTTCPTCGQLHSRAAERLAEIIIPQGINNRGGPAKIATAYGNKTRCGLAAMIDEQTAAPALLAACIAARDELALWQNFSEGKDSDTQAVLTELTAAIAQAEGSAP